MISNKKQLFIKTTFTFYIFIISTFSVFCQNHEYSPNPKYPLLFKTIPLITDESPEWVKMMYSKEPNIFKINAAFKTYYQNHLFQKNTHTQNLKYFNRFVKNQNYLLEDGSIRQPTIEQEKKKKKIIRNKAT